MTELFALFDEIGLPYARQGSLSEDEYAPSFFTFWNINTIDGSFYDNKESRYIEYIQIGFYTNDAQKIYSQLDENGEFRTKARSRGFIVERAHDAPSGKRDYYGRVCNIKIIHNT